MFQCYRYTKVIGSYGNQYPALAWEFNVDNPTNTMSFRVSRCSINDNFSKEVARDVLSEKSWINTHIDRNLSLVENAINTIQSMLDGGPSYFNDLNEYQLCKKVVRDYRIIQAMNYLINNFAVETSIEYKYPIDPYEYGISGWPN